VWIYSRVKRRKTNKTTKKKKKKKGRMKFFSIRSQINNRGNIILSHFLAWINWLIKPTRGKWRKTANENNTHHLQDHRRFANLNHQILRKKLVDRLHLSKLFTKRWSSKWDLALLTTFLKQPKTNLRKKSRIYLLTEIICNHWQNI